MRNWHRTIEDKNDSLALLITSSGSLDLSSRDIQQASSEGKEDLAKMLAVKVIYMASIFSQNGWTKQ